MDRFAKQVDLSAAARPAFIGPPQEHVLMSTRQVRTFWDIVFRVLITDAGEYELAEQQNEYLRTNEVLV